LFHFKLGLSLIAANLLSTTLAMIFSYFANRHVVFRSTHGSVWRQAALFWAITACSLYVLQTGIIWVFSHPFNGFALQVARLVHSVLPGFSTAFIVANGIKVIATLASLVWNYTLYKKFVFTTPETKQ
jgi:putative flippase GtrA